MNWDADHDWSDAELDMAEAALAYRQTLIAREDEARQWVTTWVLGQLVMGFAVAWLAYQCVEPMWLLLYCFASVIGWQSRRAHHNWALITGWMKRDRGKGYENDDPVPRFPEKR